MLLISDKGCKGRADNITVHSPLSLSVHRDRHDGSLLELGSTEKTHIHKRSFTSELVEMHIVCLAVWTVYRRVGKDFSREL